MFCLRRGKNPETFQGGAALIGVNRTLPPLAASVDVKEDEGEEEDKPISQPANLAAAAAAASLSFSSATALLRQMAAY